LVVIYSIFNREFRDAFRRVLADARRRLACDGRRDTAAATARTCRGAGEYGAVRTSCTAHGGAGEFLATLEDAEPRVRSSLRTAGQETGREMVSRNGISIGSAVLAQLIVVSNSQTDTDHAISVATGRILAQSACDATLVTKNSRPSATTDVDEHLICR